MTREERLAGLKIHLRAAEAHRAAYHACENARRSRGMSGYRLIEQTKRGETVKPTGAAVKLVPDQAAIDCANRAWRVMGREAGHAHSLAADAHLAAARRAGLGLPDPKRRTA